MKHLSIWLQVLMWVALAASVPSVQAKEIPIPKPADSSNIQPALATAINQSSSGDTIVFPAGAFVFDGSISTAKTLKLVGQGRDRTKLYRRSNVSDATLESWKTMITFSCSNRNPSQIVVAGIAFEGKKPSQKSGDGLSQARDRGIRLTGCLDFLITGNRFSNFGDAAVAVHHYDTAARGVVADNEFYNNWKINTQEDRGTTTGYGVLVSSTQDDTWKANPEFGSNNFIFIENNLFDNHRHAIAGGGAGLYVFRYNRLVHNWRGHVIDAHGGGAFGNGHSTRAYEIYQNELDAQVEIDGTNRGLTAAMAQPCQEMAYAAMKFRGGQGLVHHNQINGYRYGIRLDTEVSGSYPIPYQIGYQNGDLYIWENTFVPYKTALSCTNLYLNEMTTLIQRDRDFHLKSLTGYTPFQYPHPLRQQLGAGLTTPTPTAPTSPTPRPTPSLPPGFTKLTITPTQITASGHDGNLPTNVIDSNLGSRWSANGDNQWLQIDLGQVYRLGGINLAVYEGATRTNQFELQISNSDRAWQTVWSGASSGTTLNLEFYPLADSQARYLRYLGHGNSVNTWNSVTEIEIFGQPVVLPSPPSCRYDLNGDAQITVADLLLLLNAWGQHTTVDLLNLIAMWGQPCPESSSF